MRYSRISFLAWRLSLTSATILTSSAAELERETSAARATVPEDRHETLLVAAVQFVVLTAAQRRAMASALPGERKPASAPVALLLGTISSSVRPSPAGYCFVCDSDCVRVSGSGAPETLQDRRSGHEANPLLSSPRGLRGERAGGPQSADCETCRGSCLLSSCKHRLEAEGLTSQLHAPTCGGRRQRLPVDRPLLHCP
jgi:hypothetical protein